jgi:hypothetical protein
MDKDIQLAHIWREIIRLAFCPSSTNDKLSWITCYSKSLIDFWEISEPPKQERFKLNVYNISLPIGFEFTYESIKKFGVEFLYCSKSNREFMWQHHSDKSYFEFPEQELLTIHSHRSRDLRKAKMDDVEFILDSLIFHPTSHQHIVDPPDYHEIRIAGGISNPFLFLFHLRYQLCLIDQKRMIERNRLTELFYNAIKRNCTGISPSTLLDLS